jgi:hypothetical protein
VPVLNERLVARAATSAAAVILVMFRSVLKAD